MILNLIFGFLALLSLALTLWQWLVARRFPLHQRISAPSSPSDLPSSRGEEALTSPPRPSPLATPHEPQREMNGPISLSLSPSKGERVPEAGKGARQGYKERIPSGNSLPSVTLLKPLKGCDAATEECLRSWFAQQYRGPMQILFGVAAAEDPVCGIVRKLLQEFTAIDAQLVVGSPLPGANAKVAKLAELEGLAKHELLVISDADVRVPRDFLANIVAPLGGVPLPLDLVGTRSTASVTLPEENGTRWNASLPGSEAQANGLVCCFYRLANPTTLAMQWEAIAVNADFWSQVLQARSLKPLDFALGAVMATRRQQLQEIGGFAGLVDCLADDYQLGNRIARRGYAIALSPVVVECWSAPMGWADVWKHQLRWARTIRVCQPVPYFFSILSNATLWPVVWFMVKPGATVAVCSIVCLFVRIVTALNLQGRLNREPNLGGGAFPRDQTSTEKWARGDARPPATHTPAQPRGRYTWLIPVKDLLQAAMWLLAFLGNKIEWRGQRMRLRPDGTLERSKLPLA